MEIAIKKSVIIGWIMAFLVILSLGCESQQRSWGKTCKTNTIEAYQKFLQKYPNSIFAHEAISCIENLEWENTTKIGNIEAYQKFLQKYPNSTFAHKTILCIENLEWENTTKIGNIEAYKEFVVKHPSSNLVSKANQKLKELKWKKLGDGIFLITNGLKYRWWYKLGYEDNITITDVTEGGIFLTSGPSIIPLCNESENSIRRREQTKINGGFYFESLADAVGVTWIFRKAIKSFVLGDFTFKPLVDKATIKFGSKEEGILVKGFEIRPN